MSSSSYPKPKLKSAPSVRARGLIVSGAGLAIFFAAALLGAQLRTEVRIPMIVLALPLLAVFIGVTELITDVSVFDLRDEWSDLSLWKRGLVWVSVPVLGCGAVFLFTLLISALHLY